MKIFVIKSSPHKNGSSNLLADEFIRGTKEKGHEITVFDAARANLHPCLGCDRCGMSGPCTQKDDMTEVRASLLKTDIVVFVTPLYYFGMSTQLKTVIDRFYSFNGALTSRHLKSVLIAAAWNNDDWTMRDLQNHYLTLCQYLNFENKGMILGTSCGTVSMTKHTNFPKQAYEMGKAIGA